MPISFLSNAIEHFFEYFRKENFTQSFNAVFWWYLKFYRILFGLQMTRRSGGIPGKFIHVRWTYRNMTNAFEVIAYNTGELCWYWRTPLILASSVDIDKLSRYRRTHSISARAQLRLSNLASIARLKYSNFAHLKR